MVRVMASLLENVKSHIMRSMCSAQFGASANNCGPLLILVKRTDKPLIEASAAGQKSRLLYVWDRNAVHIPSKR